MTSAAMRAFLAFIVLAAVVWFAIGVGANARAPGAVGLAATIFGGAFASLLIVAVGGGIALKLNAMRSATPFATPSAGADPIMASVLAELQLAQAPVVQLMAERAAWRTPTCAAAGAGLWSLAVIAGANGGVLDFSIVLVSSGLLGLFWARYQAMREQASIYLEVGVGGLARRIAGLSWRADTAIDFRRLQAEGVLPRGGVHTSGELSGMTHGVSVRIAPVNTDKADDIGGGAATAFTGVVIELERPSNPAGLMPATSMEELALRNPRLPIRIGLLASLAGLGAPRSAAAGDRVSIAAPETTRLRLFDPPPGRGAIAATARLERLRSLLETVTGIAKLLAEEPREPGAPPA